MFHVTDFYLYWYSVSLQVCLLKYITCFSCNNKLSDLLFFWKCTAWLPQWFFFPINNCGLQCSAFCNTVLAFSNSTAKLGWLFPQVRREWGGSNLVFNQFYLLSQIYLFHEFVPFCSFFCFCPSIPSLWGWDDSFLNFMIEKINDTSILLVLENNFLNCASVLSFLTVLVWRVVGEDFTFVFIFPVLVVLVTAGKSVRGYVARSQQTEQAWVYSDMELLCVLAL